ncbi:MAG: hypothetical protein HY221_01115 [Candidatus Sungbacteria bacterium]|uniref:DUF3592 domain-containing protein n=1 Tax=Candidatus Sungiibacteriota bacterium TaxID=2750080 RepID=A0A932R1E2_9BACT|nr:hypothetical protein [Candidatus Sungbacteria bacterium]
MNSGAVSPYILIFLSLFLVSANAGLVLFFMRMKKVVLGLFGEALEAKGTVVRQRPRSDRGDGYVVDYRFMTATGEEVKASQVLTGKPNGSYENDSSVIVLYRPEKLSVNCLKNELEQKLKSVKSFDIVARILSLSTLPTIGLLWFGWYQAGIIGPF